ncbi:MAG: hypothetical protein ACXVCP_19105 [Bdellovibrio sp.]
MTNKKVYRLSFLLVSLFLSVSALCKAETESATLLVKDACRYFDGDPTSPLGPIHSSQDLLSRNPLMPSKLGRIVLRRNFKNSFKEMKYLVNDDDLDSLIGSLEFKQALDECYSQDDRAKTTFVLLLKKLEYDAKTSAGYAEAFTWFGTGLVTSKLLLKLGTRYTRFQNLISWTFKTVTVLFMYDLALQTVKFVKYSQGNKSSDLLKIPEAEINKMKEDSEYSSSLAKSLVMELKQQIQQLEKDYQQMNDGPEKEELGQFIKEQKEQFQKDFGSL